MTIEIYQVPAPVVPSVWPDALALLEEPIARSQGCYLPEDVLQALALGLMDLWLAAKGEEIVAAYVTEIVHFPRKRMLRATFAGGAPHTMDEWLEPMVRALEEGAKACGCAGMMAMGRRGWTKVVEGKEVATVIWRDFPAGVELQ